MVTVLRVVQVAMGRWTLPVESTKRSPKALA
ncbi:MAG: hypothetical protein BWY86_01091 [Candidatus Aminicenantes bacterium ADurb.Bin508]|nr:MAG: hypothetical protein BWY86_01091 [Candidatus Aminicenantes bacterium ADurb.Bin508]